MAYPEQLLIPMRQDLTRHGVEETRTPAEVDRVLAENGTVLMVVNSVCGCAAGKARPGIGHGICRRGRCRRRSSARDSVELPAVVAVDRAIPERQTGLHDASQRH
jgi:putative YphP/YqiW family bacilliredoxin